MKQSFLKKHILKAICLLGLISSLGILFTSNKSKPATTGAIKTRVSNCIEDFKKDLSRLKKVAEKEKSAKSINQKLIVARARYKQMEAYIGYFSPALEKDIIGANIPIIKTDVKRADVSTPHSLQVIEELLAEDSVDYATIVQECLLVEKSVIEWQKQWNKLHLESREVFEANRSELIRISTLGITGFDSPVLQLSLEEAKIALSVMEKDLANYSAFLPTTDQMKNVSKQIQHCMNQLDGQDFDSFDRMAFLREGTMPLYASLLDLHKATGFETIDEIGTRNLPFNYQSRNLFDEDFLNPLYHSRYKTGEQAEASADLGQMLFFDPVMSSDGKRSCASCHKPELGFTDGETKSMAFGNESRVKRNSPTLINCAFQSSFFHDMRAENLEEQMVHVVVSPEEFNTDLNEISEKLRKSPEYIQLFKNAFPTYHDERAVNPITIQESVASYVRSLTALNAPFDQYMRGETNEIDEQVRHGFNLFMGKAGCGTCHFAPIFNGTVPPYYTDTEGEILGVPVAMDSLVLDPDRGRGSIFVAQDQHPALEFMFKTPTIRNAELTAPYMHNGGLSTLEEVMEFYNNGGGKGMGLDVPDQTLPEDKLNLTKEEKSAMIAFMKSLTDTSGLRGRPKKLPAFPVDSLNERVAGGEY